MRQAHIHCESVNKDVIIVGDPARVQLIATMLESPIELAHNREYLSISGVYKNSPVTVISTGMGAPSTLICIEELILCGAKNIIRVGSAGAYQAHINLGELIIVEGAVRDEGGSKAYIEPCYPAVSDLELTFSIIEQAKKMNYKYHQGIIRSNDSFYTDKENSICAYWNTKNILAADMETSALLTLARLRGIKASSILNNVVLYQDNVQQSILNFSESETLTKEGEIRSIILALETFSL